MLEQTTTVATPWPVRTAVWSLLPLVGAALGWALDRAADWAADLPLPILRGPLRVIAGLPEPGATYGALALGALAGLVLAFFVDQESLSVRLSLADVELRRPGTVQVLPRTEVAIAYPEHERLVLLDRDGRELAREPSHLSAKRLAPLFRKYSIEWAESDPYADTYRRWVPGLPDLPAADDALFAARQRALDRGDSADAAELRTELARLGYVVRGAKKHQQFRRTQPLG